MSGERYTNGLMEGMLLGRAEVADSQAGRTNGEKRDAYLNAAKYARLALIETRRMGIRTRCAASQGFPLIGRTRLTRFE